MDRARREALAGLIDRLIAIAVDYMDPKDDEEPGWAVVKDARSAAAELRAEKDEPRWFCPTCEWSMEAEQTNRDVAQQAHDEDAADGTRRPWHACRARVEQTLPPEVRALMLEAADLCDDIDCSEHGYRVREAKKCSLCEMAARLRRAVEGGDE